MTRIKSRINPSIVLSTAALFVALSGAAVAANGTIGSGDVKDNSLKSIDLKDEAAVQSQDVINNTLASDDIADDTLTSQDVALNTLTSQDVADDTLLAQDLAPDSVGQSEIADNSVGTGELQANSVNSGKIADATVTSDDLAPNSVSAQEIGDGIHTHYNSTNVGGGTAENGAYIFQSVTATCGAGEELISGSAEWTNEAQDDELMISEVILNHNAESVTVKGGNDSGSDATLWADAQCL